MSAFIEPTTEQLLAVLEAAVSEAPPRRLGQALLANVRRLSDADRPGPASATDCVVAVSRDLGAVLGQLAADDWDRPAVNGLTVHRLLGHLRGADRYLGRRLGFWDHGAVDPDELDHLATSRAEIAETDRDDPATTIERWRSGNQALLTRLAGLPDERLDEAQTYNRVEASLGAVLVVRAFEVWTHTDDIRRATGRAVQPPDPATLATMTAFAADVLVPGITAAAGSEPVSSGTIRLVLTGPGGGTWDRTVGPDLASGRPDTVLVADAVGYCRLIAARTTADELAPFVQGRSRLAELALAGAPTFALD